METILKIKNLEKTYANGTTALRGVSFDVKQGEFLVIIGLSGSGKSTLLRCINRLHDPSNGNILFSDKEVTTLSGRDLRSLRSKIGMIFQQFNLIPRQNVLTNVLTGSLSRTGIIASLFGLYSKEEKASAHKYIKIVGLEGKEKSRADNLSGGQQQRGGHSKGLNAKPATSFGR